MDGTWVKAWEQKPPIERAVLILTLCNNEYVAKRLESGAYFVYGQDDEIQAYHVRWWSYLPDRPSGNDLFSAAYSGGTTESPLNVSCGKEVFLIHATQHAEVMRMIDFLNENISFKRVANA